MISKSRFAYGLLVLLIFCAPLKEEARNFRGVDMPSAMPNDFPVYYVAGSLAATGRELYNVPQGDPALRPYFVLSNVPSSSDWARQAQGFGFHGASPFIYPPFAALIMRPLSFFSPRLSLFLWRCVSGLLTALSVYFILASFARTQIGLKFVLALAGAFSFFPLVETIDLGQANALILACWAIGIYLAVNNKFTLSALCFAVGTLIKINPVLAVGVFVIRRQWKWLAAYFIWLLILISISVGVSGWAAQMTYVRTVLPTLSCGAPIAENKSLAGLIQSLAIGNVVILDSSSPKLLPLIPAACHVAVGLSAVLYVGILFFFYRQRNSQEALVSELAAVALLSLLISPVSWRHHFLLALIPLIYLWLPETKLLKQWQLIALTAATLIIGTPFADYAARYLHGNLRLFLNGLQPVATMVLLGLGMPWTLPDPKRVVDSGGEQKNTKNWKAIVSSPSPS
jgi:hypothetical protein